MSDKKLTILGIVAVCMVIWAVVQFNISNKPKTASESAAYLIQGLNPAEIGSIVLGTGEKQVTLKRQGDNFIVVNKDNYLADTKKINDLIAKCLDIQTSQFITDNPNNYNDLGLTEKDARSVVKFLKPDDSLLAGIIIGNAKEAGRGTYVRLANNNNVYIASEAPWISSAPMDYINEELISADRKNIVSVTVSSPDGQYCLKKKDNSEDIVLENIPAGKKLKDSDSKSVFNAETDMRFTDVKKQPAGSGDLTFDRQFVCRLADSTVYTVKIAQKDGKTFVICQAEFTDTAPVTVKKEGESEEELKKKEAKLLARDKAKTFSTKHQGWIYEIADWKAQNLTKNLADLLEDEPKPEQKVEQKAEEKQRVEQKVEQKPEVKPEEKKPEQTEKPAEPNVIETKSTEM